MQAIDRPRCDKCSDCYECDGHYCPKVLKCGHSFCVNCLTILNDLNEVKCFVCFITNSYKEIPKNYEVIEVVDSVIKNRVEFEKPYCTLCFNNYEIDGRRSPIVLFCGHSFCSNCSNDLKKIVNDNDTNLKEICCPKCRERYRYQNEPPKNLCLTNFLQELLETPVLPRNFEDLTTFDLADDDATLNSKSHKLSLELAKAISVFSTYAVKIESLGEDEFNRNFNEEQISIVNRTKLVLSCFDECYKIIFDFHKRGSRNKRDDFHNLFNKIRHLFKNNEELKKSIEELKSKLSELATECENFYNYPSLYKIEQQLKRSESVKFKKILEAAVNDIILVDHYCVRVGIVGRIKAGKSSLSNTLRDVSSSNDYRLRSPVDHKICTPIPLYHLHRFKYKDVENIIYYVDFPGYEKHDEVADNESSYFKMMKREGCDMFILVCNEVQTDEDKAIRRYFDERKIEYFVVRTKADSMFVNKYVDLYDERYSMSLDNYAIEERVVETMDLLRSSDDANDKHIYYLGCDKYNSTGIDFDKAILKNNIYSLAYKYKNESNLRNSPGRIRNIRSYGTTIINTMRAKLKINVFHEAVKAGLAGIIPFMDLVLKHFSKEAILDEFGMNNDLKLYIRNLTPNIRTQESKTQWFQNIVNDLSKIGGIAGGVALTLADDAVKVGGIVSSKAAGVAIGAVAFVATPVLSGYLTHRDLESFINNTGDDMVRLYKEFVNELVKKGYGEQVFVFYNQLLLNLLNETLEKC